LWVILGIKRRTNPSFLSNDEAARDRRRTRQMVGSILHPGGSGSIVPNKGYDPIPHTRKHWSEPYEIQTPVVTENNYAHLHDLADRTSKQAKIAKEQIHTSRKHIYRETRRSVKTIKTETLPSINVLGETKNLIVQFNFDNHLIEIYAKDFFFNKLFKLKIRPEESKKIGNLLAETRNRLYQRSNALIGETEHFAVEMDGIQKNALLYEKTEKEIKLGINETEITSILDFLRIARSLF
jgi:hypothetical protein